MGATSSRLRLAALVASGALAVHQLRYLFVYGDGSRGALAIQGHAYFSLLVPVLIAVLALAIAGFAARVATAASGRDRPAEAAPRIGRLWAGASALLALIHFSQEWLEGILEPGHPSGLGGLLGHGGWIAIGLAIAIGGIVAMLQRGAAAAIEQAGRGAPRLRRERPHPGAPALEFGERIPIDPLARHLAGRGPPLLFV
jgi:hypothetical protein